MLITGLELAILLKGISSKDMAKQLNVSLPQFCSWTNKSRKIPEKYKGTIADIIGMDVSFIEKEFSNDDLNKIQKYIEKEILN